jgi:putative spermidine/putrescine transport system substrate-binding protein
VAQAQTSNVTLKVATFGGHSGDVEASYVGSRYTRTTGVKVEWIHGNPSDHFAKMLAARGREAPFDVVLLDDAVQNAATRAGLVAKLTPEQVPNLKQLYPQALNKEGYGPWVILYSVGIVYNKDKLKAAGIPEPTSWEDLWDPKLAGHISVPDMSLPQGADFVIKIAQLNGATEANVIPALEKISKIKAHSYYTSSATLGQQLASGDVWVSVWTSGRSWALISQGYPIGYVIPKEGSVLGIDTVDMVASTSHVKEALNFINMQLDPLSQLGWAWEMSYGPSNKTLASVFQSYPAIARKMPSSDADLNKLHAPNWAVYNANLKKATDFWNRNVKK